MMRTDLARGRRILELDGAIRHKRRFRPAALALLALPGAPGMAHDEPLKLSPLVEARLRGEHVEQDGLADSADAFTVRVRTGVQATADRWNALVEAQGTLAIVDRYFDGLHGSATRPLIADPQNIALYRAQIQYKDRVVALTLGRQRIALDNDRFVDAALFRQNAQTYDAVRVEWTGLAHLRVDATYAWQVRTVWGVDGFGVRPASIGGDNVFVEIAHDGPLGRITAFGYLSGQDDPAYQGYRLSSQTYGARIAGNRAFSAHAKIDYQLSFARQSDWQRNPNRYAAQFYLVDLGLDLARFRLGAGYEVAGAGNGTAFTSFQFPVGTGIRYRGFAGKFSPIPPDGLRDLYGSVALALPIAGPFKSVSAQAAVHRFESDRLVRHYGNEVDVQLSGKVGRYTLMARYAGCDADRFATRTRKFWLELDWAL